MKIKLYRRGTLKPFKYRIICQYRGRVGSAIHTFYAPDQKTADNYAKKWARERHATKLTRIRKESQ